MQCGTLHRSNTGPSVPNAAQVAMRRANEANEWNDMNDDCIKSAYIRRTLLDIRMVKKGEFELISEKGDLITKNWVRTLFIYGKLLPIKIMKEKSQF